MAQIFQKIASYLANEVITKRLANSHSFMTAAHKTHQTVQKSHKLIHENKGKVAETVQGHGKGIIGFLNEIRMELFNTGKK